jgi:hypothetical protein
MMKKITDKDYQLPEVYAQRVNDNFPNSANKPLLVSGIDKATNEKGDYVVKFRKAERMSEEASMRELLASFIAMQMEIPVTEPVIVEIDSNFLDILKGNDSWLVASKSIGYNYGSKYIKEYSTIVLNKGLNNHQLPYAQDAFAFDMFIQNSDRTNNKPNLLTNGEDIIILDHEIAFGFVFAPFVTANIWDMTEEHKSWVRQHCLLPLLKGETYDFEAFSNKFDNLTEEFWIKAFQLIPETWRNDQFDSIKNILTGISVNREKFILELKKILS